jgi:hypothetical protein
MLRDLDKTIKVLLTSRAPVGSLLSGADVSFELPDANWRGSLSRLTVNCYLYDIHENLGLRTAQPIVVRSPDMTKAVRIRPPVRIDSTYCITAWSLATTEPAQEEHQLLSDVLLALLRNPTIPPDCLQGSLVGQIPPYPTVIASQEGTAKNHPEFWHALDQKLKPSLNYVVTLAMLLDDVTNPATGVVGSVIVAGETEPKLNLLTDQKKTLP